MEFEVVGSPEVVRARLEDPLLGIRSLWFTSAREVRVWASSSSPLYAHWTGPRAAVVGPRFDSIRASSFSPVWRLTLADGEPGCTRVILRESYPLVSALLVGFWVLVLALWGYGLAAATPLTSREPALLLGWGTLAIGAVAAPMVGALFGRAALAGSREWLEAQARNESVEGEDW